MPERALVIIPTYNEAANVPNLVPQVLCQDPRLEILIVDDNSPDGTGQLAEAIAQGEPRVHVLHRDGKRGLGTAYVTGFRWALEREYSYVFEMDADFSHDPAHLKHFLKATEGLRSSTGRCPALCYRTLRISMPGGSPVSGSGT